MYEEKDMLAPSYVQCASQEAGVSWLRSSKTKKERGENK
jgi:hypothetical protein